MNAPHPAEHFTLAEGEKKVEYEVDTRLDNSGTFTILKEDHTLGNILRMSLLSDKRVLFAGYRQPHPLEPKLVVKVRTRDNTDPIGAVLDSIDNLQAELRWLEDGFKRQLQEHQQLRSTEMDLL